MIMIIIVIIIINAANYSNGGGHFENDVSSQNSRTIYFTTIYMKILGARKIHF